MLARGRGSTTRAAPGKGYGTWAIYSIIGPDDETFAQGLPEDEWIIDNVAWLNDLFFENGIQLERQIIATSTMP